jgi:Fe-S cluster assembly ATP-binding protein
MLEIKDLHVSIQEKKILKGLNLKVNAGEVHAIMGPNGTGKSTLANVITGRDIYSDIQGSISYKGKDLLDMEIEDRAREGIFLSFQYPVEIPGVSITNFMRAAMDEIRLYKGEKPMSGAEFLKYLMRRKQW